MFSVFGWYGFKLRHPQDWAPTSISGARNEGYARLSSAGTLALQIRWKKHKGAFSAEKWLDTYFQKLQTDSKKGKNAFRRESKQVDDFEYEYRWVGQGQGRGTLFLDETSGRVFFLEVTGDRGGDLLSHLRSARSSFQPCEGDLELWGVFGLYTSLPRGMAVEAKKFESGRTRLSFKGKGCRIETERWALGQQLVAKHGLEAWAKSNLGWENADSKEEDLGLRLLSKGRIGQKREALVALQSESNQICIVRSSFRDAKWRPAWDWLPAFEDL